jgi:hypothetical protein
VQHWIFLLCPRTAAPEPRLAECSRLSANCYLPIANCSILLSN